MASDVQDRIPLTEEEAPIGAVSIGRSGEMVVAAEPVRNRSGAATPTDLSGGSDTPLTASDGRLRSDTADFTFAVGDSPNELLRVVRFRGVEGLSRLYAFELELVSDDPELDLEGFLKRSGTLTIRHAGGVRLVHGIIRRFERTGGTQREGRYQAVLSPLHWLLTQRRRSRIFQEHNCADMTLPGIIRKVFADSGLPPESWRFALAGSYDPREYVVQYRETDFNFISRLMEEEGVYFFFEHDEDGHRIVLADGPVAHSAALDAQQYSYRDLNGLVPEREFVFSLRERRQVKMGAARLEDFDFKRPALDLAAEANADRFTALEWSDAPGRFLEKAVGQRLAQVRLEERQCRRQTLRLLATARGLRPGCTFSLVDHPQASMNVPLLVTRVEHRGEQRPSAAAEALARNLRQYEARACAIPDGVVYRPARRTPRPFVRGSQTASVTGPEHEELYTDEYGRVKVLFHWDREGGFDEHSSCWMRVSQGLAGGNYGMMFLPRVGQEVIVDFLEGDPDRPIITGRVYNNDHMPPYKLPDARSISTIRTCSTPGAKGGNEIRFDDAKGDEQLLLFAQNELHLRARNSRLESTGGSRHATVAGDEFEWTKKNKHHRVGLDLLEVVGGNKESKVIGSELEWVYGSRWEQVLGKYALGAEAIRIESPSISFVCGANFIKIDSTGVTIVGTMVNINSGGSVDAPEKMPEEKLVQEPRPAATTDFGHNARYGGTRQDTDPADAGAGTGGSDDPGAESDASWIEIELLDELGRPWPGESYEVLCTDGRVRRGTLDRNGRAHVTVPDRGTCQVSFPRLDAAAWDRLR